jgi:hypothetical protein
MSMKEYDGSSTGDRHVSFGASTSGLTLRPRGAIRDPPRCLVDLNSPDFRRRPPGAKSHSGRHDPEFLADNSPLYEDETNNNGCCHLYQLDEHVLEVIKSHPNL